MRKTILLIALGAFTAAWPKKAKYCGAASPANSETAVNPKSTQAEEQPHSAEEYPAQLIGKRFNVRRLPLCQPGTYKGDFAHAGQQATVVSAKPNTMMPALSAMSAITPELRAMIEDQQKAATLLLQFEDGTKLDTCAPIGPKWLANYVELARAESPTRASN